MLGTSLQFGGVARADLLALLAGAIAAALLAYGLWQLLRRRRRIAAAALLAGSLGAALVVAAAADLPAEAPRQQALWLLLLTSVIIAAVAVFYSAVYAYLGRRRMTALLVLRVLAILALVLILFKPALTVPPPAGGTKLSLPVLVDRSGSMDTVDHAELPTRYRQAVEALAGQGERMSERFNVGWHHFADQVQSVQRPGELAELSPARPEAGTDLAQAIRRAAAGYTAEELAAVILISDGLHNADSSPAEAARECPVPIHVLGVGSQTEKLSGQRNVRLLSVEAPLEAVRNNVTAVTARLRLTAWANIPTRLTLSEGGREVGFREVLADSNAQEVDVKLQWTPGEPPPPASAPAPAGAPGADVRRLKLQVAPSPAESTPDDNAGEVHVLVTEPRVRVLYVEGTLRPEYKFLRRILQTDPNVQCMSLVRIRDNQYLAQGSLDGKQLAALPQSAEDFAGFDVLILGDLEREALSYQQMERIRQFVSEGKALLMLGGRRSFGPGGYGGTPVESALPVVCGDNQQGQETSRFVPQLTAAGAASPVFAGLGRYFGAPGAAAAEPLPELLGCVRVSSAKPHATVLAIHPQARNEAGPLVVLAVHQFGKGRGAAFTADTTWQWYLHLQPMGRASPYHRFWGQLIRYLAGIDATERKGNPSVLARLDKSYLRQDEDLKITASVRDASGAPAGGLAVSAEVRAGPEGSPVQLALAEPLPGEGLYEGTWRPEKPGRFTVTVAAADKQASPLGQDELPVVVAGYSRETDRLARDARTLREIAEASGGRYLELSRLPDVVDQIIQRRADRSVPAPPPSQHRLYNFPFLFLLLVGLLTAEWLLRRNWQLQ